MPKVTPGHMALGVTSDPFRYLATIADGELFVLGPNGDVDPGYLLQDVQIRNVGAKDIYVAVTLRGAVGSTSFRSLIPTGASTPVELCRGPIESIAVYNLSGSGASTKVSITGDLLPLNNAGKALPSHPGHGCYFFRPAQSPAASAAVTLTARHKITATGLYVWSKLPRTSALGFYRLTATAGGRNLLAAPFFDLETLVAATLAAPALVGAAAALNIEPNEPIVVTAQSDNADLSVGDLLIGLEYTFRNA